MRPRIPIDTRRSALASSRISDRARRPKTLPATEVAADQTLGLCYPVSWGGGLIDHYGTLPLRPRCGCDTAHILQV